MSSVCKPYGLVVATLLLISGCQEGPVETVSDTNVARPVKLVSVSVADSTEVAQFPAVIGADRLSELSIQVGGLLQEFPVSQAQTIKRGDLIAKLDSRDFESALSSARAQFENAQQEYQRAVRLSEQDAIARNVLEQRKTQLDVSRAQLNQAQKALDDSILRAPFDGVVAQTLVSKLQTVSPGQSIISLMSDESLEATIDLPASYIARIPKEEAENRDRQAFVFLDAAPNQPIEAEFKEANLVADAASQTYAVTFSFPSPVNLTVLPGMNATMELRRSGGANAPRVAVPLHAISSDGEDQFVWRVNEESMTVTRQSVTTEPGVGETIVIVDGLSADDVIVGAGAAYLSEGMKIREWQ